MATSVASSWSGPQLVTLSARYGVHEEVVAAASGTTLEQLAPLLRRGGGWAAGELYSWRAAPPRETDESRAALEAKRSAAFRKYDFDTALEIETNLFNASRNGERLRDRTTTLGQLLPRAAAWPLRFSYSHPRAGHEVELALLSCRPLRASDDADSLPRFAVGWKPVPPAAGADAAASPCFDAAFPSLVAMARGAGRGLALGCGMDEGGNVAAVWTPRGPLWSAPLRRDEVDVHGETHFVPNPTLSVDQLNARLAELERKCAAARRKRHRADASDDDDDDDYERAWSSAGESDSEGPDDYTRELSQSLSPAPSPATAAAVPRRERFEAKLEREVQRRAAAEDAVAAAAEAKAARRAAASENAPPQQQPVQPVQPAQPMRFEAAFPATAELLCADGGKKRYWVHYENRQLRLFRGLWRGPRGVLNLDMRKGPAWVAAARHVRVHDALAELEAHLLARTGRGRALVAAQRRAEREQQRASLRAAKAAERAAKARERQRRQAEKAQAQAARAAQAAAKAAQRAAKALL